MFETAFTLSLTQFARSLSMPERIQKRTGRNAALEAFRLRNTGLDAVFYDVKALTPEEVFYVSDAIAAEGLIMIVPPSGGPMLTVCDSIEEYLLRGGRDVHMLAVAGIGGSALGAAAFARNVADAMGEPVAAVVSGFGLGDIVNEAIGGAFLFGWLGNFRNQCEVIDDVVGRPRLGAYSDQRTDKDQRHKACLDVDTVQALLADGSLSFDMLVGHSKGNLVLSEALYELRKTASGRLKALGATARIVTFGARITMPPEFSDVVDVMGGLDWYGEMNSRPKIDSDIRIPMAGHSTNTDLVGSLPVTAILRDISAKAPLSPAETGHEIMVLPEPAVPVLQPVEFDLGKIPDAVVESVAAPAPETKADFPPAPVGIAEAPTEEEAVIASPQQVEPDATTTAQTEAAPEEGKIASGTPAEAPAAPLKKPATKRQPASRSKASGRK